MSTRSISTAPAPPQEADSTIQTIDALAELGVSLSKMQRQRRQIPRALRPDLAKASAIGRRLWKRMQDGTLLGKGPRPSGAQDIGGDIECAVGHLRGIAFYFHDVGDGGDWSVRAGEHGAPEAREERERRVWLFHLLVEAMERECDKLEALAAGVYQLDRAATREVPS